MIIICISTSSDFFLKALLHANIIRNNIRANINVYLDVGSFEVVVIYSIWNLWIPNEYDIC